jgi:hypothetical protein
MPAAPQLKITAFLKPSRNIIIGGENVHTFLNSLSPIVMCDIKNNTLHDFVLEQIRNKVDGFQMDDLCDYKIQIRNRYIFKRKFKPRHERYAVSESLILDSRVESGKEVLSRSYMGETITWFNFCAYRKSKIVSREYIQTCSICMEEPSDIELKCQHQFCRDCVNTWVNKCIRSTAAKEWPSCPYCRSEITSVTRMVLNN